MRDSERAGYVYRRCRQMAASGLYKDHLDIETALAAEGYPEARDLLDSGPLRQELNAACGRARKGQPHGTDPS